MRKDKGLNGDLDRLPMLTWIMFLKFLDDLEIQRQEEAELAKTKFKPIIEPPYRWRDWAAVRAARFPPCGGPAGQRRARSAACAA